MLVEVVPIRKVHMKLMWKDEIVPSEKFTLFDDGSRKTSPSSFDKIVDSIQSLPKLHVYEFLSDPMVSVFRKCEKFALCGRMKSFRSEKFALFDDGSRKTPDRSFDKIVSSIQSLPKLYVYEFSFDSTVTVFRKYSLKLSRFEKFTLCGRMKSFRCEKFILFDDRLQKT